MSLYYALPAKLSVSNLHRLQLTLRVSCCAWQAVRTLPCLAQNAFLHQQKFACSLTQPLNSFLPATTSVTTPKRLKQCKYIRASRRLSSSPRKKDNEEMDDLQAILKDRSMGLTAKFKLLFKQYGVVMIAVHLVTAAFWVTLFYIALDRGIDVIPLMENIGVFDLLERLGLSYAEKLKSSSASNWLMTYLLYELAKPVRYAVTLIGTVYTVRYLRRVGYFKPPPNSATVGQYMDTQRRILRQRINRTSSEYRERYGRRTANGHARKINGQAKFNGLKRKRNNLNNGNSHESG